MKVKRVPVVLVGLVILVATGACSSGSTPSAPSPVSTSATSDASPSSGNGATAAMAEVRGVIRGIDAARMVFALQTPRGAKRVRAVERTEIIILESRRPVPFSALAKGMNVAVRGVEASGILNARWIAILPRR